MTLVDGYPEVRFRDRYWTVEERGTGLLLRRPEGICWVSASELETLPRRRRGMPRGRHGLLTDDQLRNFYDEHLNGSSIRELDRRHWEAMGSSSPKSAAMVISDGFKRLGLQARNKGRATAASNKLRRGPDSPGTGDRAAYKRWLLEKKGHRRPCAGRKLGYPRKGSPCTRFAMIGSDFCLQHDPERRREVVATVQMARAAA